MVLLHQGNTESFSITASLCLTNCSSLHRLRARLIIRQGEIPHPPPPPPHCKAFLQHKASYLMHRCGPASSDGQEGSLKVTCGWQNAKPSKQSHVRETHRTRRDGEGEWWEGEDRAETSAKVSGGKDRRSKKEKRQRLFEICYHVRACCERWQVTKMERQLFFFFFYPLWCAAKEGGMWHSLFFLTYGHKLSRLPSFTEAKSKMFPRFVLIK